MEYLAVLGRQPEISIAELRAQFGQVSRVGEKVATFRADVEPVLARFGGSLKFAVRLDTSPLEFLSALPEGKITLGVSDYSSGRASARSAQSEALKLKKILKRHGRNVRVLPNSGPAISTATAHHNFLGEKPCHVELILVDKAWYASLGAQNITAYRKRDQERPFRDAKVGMLPPKLAQILINLCGPLQPDARILDPFCGTGVVLQEALLMGFQAYGTDLSPRMVEFSEKNLVWATKNSSFSGRSRALAQVLGPSKELFSVAQGDATSYTWKQPIDAVACETYLGPPMSTPPAEIKLQAAKQECGGILLGFLSNISGQITAGTPLVLAIPAWLRPDGRYSRLNLIDKIEKLGYNVEKNSGSDLLYARAGQVVAREIIILRKK